MIISCGLPTCMEGMMYSIPFASSDDLITITKYAEKLGYHSVWGNDHMTTQKYVRDKYSHPPNFWEPLITYSHLAAHTRKILFGTGMLVLPLRRDIVVLAKQLATLDHLSNGRLMLALGVGAYREEFLALNSQWKVHRGELLEEGVQILIKLFNEKTVTWKGKYFQIRDVEMYPKPTHSIPIYFGGNSYEAIRRTAKYGNGWLPACMPIKTAREKVSYLKDMVEVQNRKYDEIDVAMQPIVRIDNTNEKAISNFRKSQMYNHLDSLRNSTLKDQVETKHEDANLIGNPDTVIEKAIKYKEAGVKHLCGIYFCANNVEELLEQMAIFAEKIIPIIS